MVRTSGGIREKLRSNALKELAKERGVKRGPSKVAANKTESGSDDDHKGDEHDEEISRLEQERRMKRARQSNNNLLSILPPPKNSSSFGPTVRLDKLLQMPERADDLSQSGHRGSESPVERFTEDGMFEVDVSKVVGDLAPSLIKDLTIEKVQPGAVVVPKGKEKQKNQITYLAKLGVATELEAKERLAHGRQNKAVSRSKYGW